MKCTKCKKHEAMHYLSGDNYCCYCWKDMKQTPSDWHTVCGELLKYDIDDGLSGDDKIGIK